MADDCNPGDEVDDFGSETCPYCGWHRDDCVCGMQDGS